MKVTVHLEPHELKRALTLLLHERGLYAFPKDVDLEVTVAKIGGRDNVLGATLRMDADKVPVDMAHRFKLDDDEVCA